jgi:hypothetical protein
VLYRARANVFMATSVVPDAIFPYRMRRGVPSTIVVPVFTAEGGVLNPDEVAACRAEIQALEEAEEASEAAEAEHDALMARLEAGALLRSPTETDRDNAWAQLLLEEEAHAGTGGAPGKEDAAAATAAAARLTLADEEEDDPGAESRPWPSGKERAVRVDVRHPVRGLRNLSGPTPVTLASVTPSLARALHLPSHGSFAGGADAAAGLVAGSSSSAMDDAKAYPLSPSSPARRARSRFGVATTPGSPGPRSPDSMAMASPGTPEAARELQIMVSGGLEKGARDRRHLLRLQCFRIVPQALKCLDCACLGYLHFDHKVWRAESGWNLRNQFMDLVERVQDMMKVRGVGDPRRWWCGVACMLCEDVGTHVRGGAVCAFGGRG